jgi:hypothetical protein
MVRSFETNTYVDRLGSVRGARSNARPYRDAAIASDLTEKALTPLSRPIGLFAVEDVTTAGHISLIAFKKRTHIGFGTRDSACLAQDWASTRSKQMEVVRQGPVAWALLRLLEETQEVIVECGETVLTSHERAELGKLKTLLAEAAEEFGRSHGTSFDVFSSVELLVRKILQTLSRSCIFVEPERSMDGAALRLRVRRWPTEGDEQAHLSL